MAQLRTTRTKLTSTEVTSQPSPDAMPIYKHTIHTAYFGSEAKFYSLACQGITLHTNDIAPLMHDIPREEIYPVFTGGITRVPQDVYIGHLYARRPGLSSYARDKGTQQIATAFLAQVKVYELVKHNPHSNIGGYNGVLVEGGRVVAIILDKYNACLEDVAAALAYHVRAKYLRLIMGAVQHLHRMGLAHNDVSARNVMIAEGGVPMLVNLDKCREFGAPLEKEVTARGSSHGVENVSSLRNDSLGLARLKEFLRV